MIGSFYTLRALAEAWHNRLTGATLADAYSQEAGELVLAFEGGPNGEDGPQRVCIGVERPLLFAFRTGGAGKAKSNVATLFEAAHGRRVAGVRIARRDRHLFFDLAGGAYFQVPLFGARANALLVETDGDAPRVAEAFRNHAKHAGTPPPEPQPAPMPEDFAAFEDRWKPGRNTVRQAISSAFTLFGPVLAAETAHRAGVDAEGDPAACDEAARQRLFEAAQALREAVRTPAPRLHADGWGGGTFALVALQHRADEEAEAFATVDEAARVYVRRRLAKRRYETLRGPLEDALTRAVEREQRTIDSLEGQLGGPPRAERYERYGHLLKAQAHAVEPGAEEVALPDYFADASRSNADDESAELPTATIPLQPELSAIQNAERYYDKAKGARTEREKAAERLDEAPREQQRAERLLGALRETATLKELRRFYREREEALARYKRTGHADESDESAFRRFPLKGGYTILAGKNARQNHDLTFHHAQPYDLWLHARRVPGAHVVLRLPSRDTEPDRRAVQAAAGVAAYYSKARTSRLVPVMATRRKYVTSPSGAPPGQVRVEREEVVMAEPQLPD